MAGTSENLTEEFVAKVDAFAATLDGDEQAMLVDLLVGDDGEVTGFAAGWPGLGSLVGGLGIATVGGGSPSGVQSTVGAAPDGVFVPGRTDTGFQGTGGGSPKV